jgi:hypothetical protein
MEHEGPQHGVINSHAWVMGVTSLNTTCDLSVFKTECNFIMAVGLEKKTEGREILTPSEMAAGLMTVHGSRALGCLYFVLNSDGELKTGTRERAHNLLVKAGFDKNDIEKQMRRRVGSHDETRCALLMDQKHERYVRSALDKDVIQWADVKHVYYLS